MESRITIGGPFLDCADHVADPLRIGRKTPKAIGAESAPLSENDREKFLNRFSGSTRLRTEGASSRRLLAVAGGDDVRLHRVLGRVRRIAG
ncbi:MAG TPA: hypothetical protein VNN79_20050, partial [Actinomycetota bacterium]|nr:hypothetical protein [Actinomycetota bacterium]